MKFFRFISSLLFVVLILSVISCDNLFEKKLVKVIIPDDVFSIGYSDNLSFEYGSNNKIKRILVDSIEHIYEYIWDEDSIIEFRDQDKYRTYIISNGKVNEIREISSWSKEIEITTLFYNEEGNLNSLIEDDDELIKFDWEDDNLVRINKRYLSLNFEYSDKPGSCPHYFFDKFAISYLQIVYPELFGLKSKLLPKKFLNNYNTDYEFYDKNYDIDFYEDLEFEMDDNENIIKLKGEFGGERIMDKCKIGFQYIWE